MGYWLKLTAATSCATTILAFSVFAVVHAATGPVTWAEFILIHVGACCVCVFRLLTGFGVNN